ncbi:unnamed protein product, partial [Choristocarpus tenellus]
KVRLCDACLRSTRDSLLRASTDLGKLSAFWQDKQSRDRRMGIVKSLLLALSTVLVLGAVLGKRVAVGQDQARMSAVEFLLDWHLNRLGEVQHHLQARPEALLGGVSA